MPLPPVKAETVVAVLYIGSVIGSIVGGYMCDRFGRRTCILWTDTAFLLGAIVLASAPNYGTILLGRFLVGISVGVSALADVSYLAEISPEDRRGALVSCNEASVSVGFLLAYIFSYVITVTIEYEEGWRIMFACSGLIALTQWFFMLGLPESPVWLDDQGREAEAAEALKVIHRGCYDSAWQESGHGKGEDIEVLAVQPKEEEKPAFLLNEDGPPHPHEHQPLLHYWRQFVIVIVLAISQQLCGQINILNFAPEIFSEVFYGSTAVTDGDSTMLLGTNIILGVVKFFITSLVIWEVDMVGRRFLLLGGMSIITLSLLCLVAAFSSETGEEGQFSQVQKALSLMGTTGVVAGYAMSYGPLTWLITSEMFPSNIRGRTIGFMTVLTYAFAAVISYTFLTGQEILGPAGPFVMYLMFSLCSLAFGYLAIPNTANVEVGGDGEEVDNLLNQTWIWRQQWCRRCCPRGDIPSQQEDVGAREALENCFEDSGEGNTMAISAVTGLPEVT